MRKSVPFRPPSWPTENEKSSRLFFTLEKTALQPGFYIDPGLPAPEYQTEGFFTTVLYKNKNTVKESGLTYNGAYYHIEKMRKKGILTHKSGDKGGEWVIL